MLERVCRACHAGNTLEAQTCSACGAALEATISSSPLSRRSGAQLAARVRQSPLMQSKAARSIALGVAALAIDVGAALIQKRSAKPQATSSTALSPIPSPRRNAYRRREWQEFDENGVMRRRVVEHVVIKDE